MRIVCVAGMPGAGKSVVTSVAREMGLPIVVMGDVVREEVRRRGLEPTPEVMNRIARELRERFGPTVVAERTLEKILSLNSKVVVVDGVRSPEELEVFRRVGEVVVVAVHASPRTRFERLRRRGRPGDPRTWEEFVARDLTELRFGLGNVIALADYMIVNEGPLEETIREARRVLGEATRGVHTG